MRISRDHAVRRAVRLAELSPTHDPNPRVGCVIVRDDGTVLAEGYHRGAGTPHAEAAAIQDAIATGTTLRGSTAYVTLEPCAHQGRTPSCARALIRAGVARVIYGASDPHDVAAGGAALLAAAGIVVEQDDEMATSSRRLNDDWLVSASRGRPVVRWKFAATLDGFSAAADGSSQWITGPAARADSHRLRARHGAIMVGTGTVLADDPHLTVRDDAGRLAPQQRLRVVLGTRPIPPHARVLDDTAETLVLPTHDLDAALREMSERGIHSVWLEGGPRLAAAFLQADLVDEVIAYLAPSLLGTGRAAAADFGAQSMADLRRFDLVEATVIEPTGTDAPEVPQRDLRLTLRPRTIASPLTVKEN